MKKFIFIILTLKLFLNFSFSFAESNVELKILKNLRCLVCQGQSISDSNSDFAQTIKIVVRDQIKKGYSEDEIYKFMTEKYGEWIVFKPSLNLVNSALWIAPYIVLILGVFILLNFTRKKKNN
jgi:cytochrome c-type biogenesis protein CcmH